MLPLLPAKPQNHVPAGLTKIYKDSTEIMNYDSKYR
jgi:hypothetical protein